MRYVTIVILLVLSSVVSRFLLWVVNPNDPEGTNLLVTTVTTGVIFAPMLLIYLVVLSKRKTKN